MIGCRFKRVLYFAFRVQFIINLPISGTYFTVLRPFITTPTHEYALGQITYLRAT